MWSYQFYIYMIVPLSTICKNNLFYNKLLIFIFSIIFTYKIHMFLCFLTCKFYIIFYNCIVYSFMLFKQYIFIKRFCDYFSLASSINPSNNFDAVIKDFELNNFYLMLLVYCEIFGLITPVLDYYLFISFYPHFIYYMFQFYNFRRSYSL